MDCCGRENTTADSCFSVPLVLNYKSDFIPPQQVLQRLPFVAGIKSKLSLKDPMYDLAGPSPSLVAPCDSPMLSQPQATWPSFPTQALGQLWSPPQGCALWRPLAPAFCRAGRLLRTTPTGARHHLPRSLPIPILLLGALTFKQNEIICYSMCSFFLLSTALVPAPHTVPGTYKFLV